MIEMMDLGQVRYKGVYTGLNDARRIEHVLPVAVRNAGSPYVLIAACFVYTCRRLIDLSLTVIAGT